MEPKKKMPKNAGCKLGITLPSAEERDRFNDICIKEGKKQPEMLLALMDLYDKTLPPNYDPTNVRISIFIYSGDRKMPRRSVSFEGRILFSSGWGDALQLTQVTAAKLWKDFDCPVGDGVPFLYSHCLNLYYDVNKKSYLIHEGIWVGARNDYAGMVIEGDIYEVPLEVSRCKYVNTFEEAYSCFSTYATPYELDGISTYLLDDIGENDSLLDEYFGKLEFMD